MKSSVLKKVSEASRVAFTPKGIFPLLWYIVTFPKCIHDASFFFTSELLAENLRAEIEATKIKILQQANSIKHKAIQEMKLSDLVKIET